MDKIQTIPCPTPNCGGKIPFDTYALIQGAQFTCPKCQGVVGLPKESTQLAKETMAKFDKLKSELLKEKESTQEFYKNSEND